jgi:hypothetical protein
MPTNTECPTETRCQWCPFCQFYLGFHECKLPKDTFGNRELFIFMTHQILTPKEAIEIGKNIIFLNSFKEQIIKTDWNIGFTFIENNYRETTEIK